MQEEFRLYDGVVYWIVRMGRTLQHEMAAQLAGIGLTNRTIAVLMAVDSAKKSTPSAIASYVGVDRAVVTRTLKELQDQALIDIAPNADDGRSHRVILTEAGKQKLDEGTACALDVNKAFAARLPDGQAEAIRRQFRAMVEEERDGARRQLLLDE